MEGLRLEKMSGKYLEQIKAYKEELLENQETMDGAAGIEAFDDLEEWAGQVLLDEKEETVQKGYVPATTFLCIRILDDKVVGLMNIRHSLTDSLLRFGGNIGYNIRLGERRKGYAKEMLRQGLVECRKLNLDRVLLTCSESNTGSRRTIEANGGVLENKIAYKDRIVLRFWLPTK